MYMYAKKCFSRSCILNRLLLDENFHTIIFCMDTGECVYNIIWVYVLTKTVV